MTNIRVDDYYIQVATKEVFRIIYVGIEYVQLKSEREWATYAVIPNYEFNKHYIKMTDIAKVLYL